MQARILRHKALNKKKFFSKVTSHVNLLSNNMPMVPSTLLRANFSSYYLHIQQTYIFFSRSWRQNRLIQNVHIVYFASRDNLITASKISGCKVLWSTFILQPFALWLQIHLHGFVVTVNKNNFLNKIIWKSIWKTLFTSAICHLYYASLVPSIWGMPGVLSGRLSEVLGIFDSFCYKINMSTYGFHQ